MDIINTLIDLVFDNFFVVIILLGILSFLTQKIRGGGNPSRGPQRRGPTSSMPPFGGDGPLGGGGGLFGRPGDGPNREPLRRQQAESAPQYPKYAEQKPERTLPADDIQPMPGVAARRQGGGAGKARAIRLDAADAAQGMIWAEVFGPPRARRRHQSRRY